MVRFPKKLWCCIGMEYYNIIWFNQGSRDNTMLRMPASPHCGLGSIPKSVFICGLSLLLTVVHALKVFLLVLWFSSLHKSQHSKFQFDLETVGKKNHLWQFPLINSIPFTVFFLLLVFIYYFISNQ